MEPGKGSTSVEGKSEEAETRTGVILGHPSGQEDRH